MAIAFSQRAPFGGFFYSGLVRAEKPGGRGRRRQGQERSWAGGISEARSLRAPRARPSPGNCSPYLADQRQKQRWFGDRPTGPRLVDPLCRRPPRRPPEGRKVNKRPAISGRRGSRRRLPPSSAFRHQRVFLIFLKRFLIATAMAIL